MRLIIISILVCFISGCAISSSAVVSSSVKNNVRSSIDVLCVDVDLQKDEALGVIAYKELASRKDEMSELIIISKNGEIHYLEIPDLQGTHSNPDLEPIRKKFWDQMVEGAVIKYKRPRMSNQILKINFHSDIKYFAKISRPLDDFQAMDLYHQSPFSR